MNEENITKLTDKIFETEVLQNPGIVFIDFYADWCGPCKKIRPAIVEAAKNYEGKIKFYEVDTDDFEHCGNLVTQYGIRSIPTMFVLKVKEMRIEEGAKQGNVDVEVIEKMIGAPDALTFLDKIQKAYEKAK